VIVRKLKTKSARVGGRRTRLLRPCVLKIVFALALVGPATSEGQRATATDSERAIESALREQNFDQAVQLAQSQLRQSPQNAKLWTLEGIALARLKRDKEASIAYNNALKISSDYLPALEGAAELEYNAGNPRAVLLLERIVKLRPDDSTAHAMLGVLAYKRHDCASAVKHFEASRQVISSQPVALTEYGSCLLDLKQAESAIPVFQEILKRQPDDSHARYNLAVVQLSAHHPNDALATLRPSLESTQTDPDLLDLASSAYEEAGDTPSAVKLVRQAIVSDPKKVKYYVDFAMISFIHQSFQVGVDMVNAGLKQNPDAAPLYVARGILYIQLGQYDKGESDFATANRLDPRQTSSAVAEGLAQMQRSNLDEALTTVRSKLKSHPQDAFLLYLEAQILFQKGVDPGTPEFKDALTAAIQSVALKPDFVLARDLLGSLYLKSGNIEQSILQSRRALQGNPSDQEALYHLIQALRKGKDSQGELPALVKRLAAVRQESRNEEATGNRYKLYEPAETNANPK
jgi:tetratricopeptide (TPR) repeat protein